MNIGRITRLVQGSLNGTVDKLFSFLISFSQRRSYMREDINKGRKQRYSSKAPSIGRIVGVDEREIQEGREKRKERKENEERTYIFFAFSFFLFFFFLFFLKKKWMKEKKDYRAQQKKVSLTLKG
jgi:hypothetical protein